MLLIMEAIFMFVAIGVALYYKDDIMPLLKSALITLGVGVFLRVPTNKVKISVDRRLGFFIVSTIWLIVTAFGALPFWFSGYFSSYTDCYFETMSGFTTTGASILKSVEIIPHGILFWRALITWIGGIGIVVIVIAFIPFIGGSGMSLFAAEVAGPSKGKLSPRLETTGKILLSIYATLTLLSIIFMWIAGMSLFDAVCHSFAALASAGFSTKDLSFAAFSPLVQYVTVFSMFAAGMNFTIFFNIMKRDYKKILINEEFKAYILITIIATLLITLIIYNPDAGLETSFRDALFQVSSISTSTGFVSADFTKWAIPASFILYLLMFPGAMSGSTSGGLKIVRVIILFKNARRIISQSIHANAYMPVKYEKAVVPDNVILNVLTVFVLYIVTYLLGVVLLVFLGVGIEESLGGAVSCMSNIGPGLGVCGGFGNYSSFPDAAKWVFTILMYMGRLEFATVIAVLIPAFWRK
ncbi:MAG: potassium transporter [Bacteroidetes bacterium]|nr:potassium transporter [Bacteroidota bacterium]